MIDPSAAEPILLLVVPGRRDLAGRDRFADVHAVDGESLAVPVVGLDEHPDGPAVRSAPFHDARRGPGAALEVVADHPGTAPDGAFGDRAVRCRIDRREQVLRPDVLPVDVVQRAVVGLADHGEAPERRPLRPVPHLVGDERVAHHADAVGVRDRDRRREESGLPYPLETGQLAVAVERVAAGEQRLVGDAVVRDDRRDPRPDRSRAHSQGTVAVDQRRDANADARDVRDRVHRPGGEQSDGQAEVSVARHACEPYPP